MNALDEAEIEGEFFLGDAAVRPPPGAQQGPEALDGVAVHLAHAVASLVAGVLAAGMTHRLVWVAPGLQTGVDLILLGVNETATADGGFDNGLDRRLLNLGQHVQNNLSTAPDQAKDRWLLLGQRAMA